MCILQKMQFWKKYAGIARVDALCTACDLTGNNKLKSRDTIMDGNLQYNSGLLRSAGLRLLFTAILLLLALAGCEGGDNAEPGTVTIISPENGTTVLVNGAEEISVRVPEGVSDIRMVSSQGVWIATGTNTVTWTGLAGPVTVRDMLTSSGVGPAYIQVFNGGASEAADSIELYFSAEMVDANSTVTIQASPTTLRPSTTSSASSTSIEAAVTNSGGGAIAYAKVAFGLSNTTGSGEHIVPQITYTDAQGVAHASLYVGTEVTSGSGLTVTATLDEALTVTPVSSSTDVVVSNPPATISIGLATTLESIYSGVGYSLPASVQVTNSYAEPVANAVVSLSLWPASYALGRWLCEPSPTIMRSAILSNEDIDKDLVLDQSPSNEDISGDGVLTPAVASAGVVAATVTTDVNGIAHFQVSYLKDNAGFIYNELRATIVQADGVEFSGTRRFWLPAMASDVDGCNLGVSPFNSAWPGVRAVADSTTVAIGGSTTIQVLLTAQDGTPLVGRNVYADASLIGTRDLIAPTLTASPQLTDTTGTATFTYTAGDQAGMDSYIFYYTVSGVQLSDNVVIVAE